MSDPCERTDGVVTIRPPRRGDSERLIAGRDTEFHRFLGPGSDDPHPVACICVDGEVVGWVDHDADRSWLLPGEVNLGYHVFATHRGRGVGSRAVQLLMHHLAITGECSVATLLIDPANLRSQALAERTRFVREADLDGNRYYKRPVPPLTYRRGEVTIRRRCRADAEMDFAARDHDHIRWLWPPDEIARWDAMAPSERRCHAERWLANVSDSFGSGPRWTFSIDQHDVRCVGGVDVNLASDHAPPGEANLSYWIHPDFRRRGVATTAASLALEFLRDHTATRRAHVMVAPDNTRSRSVAASTGASVAGATVDRHGRSLIRYRIDV